MYEAFYGLKEKAFNLNPDPEYFYMSREHEDAYRHLEYAISESKGFAVITGEVGAGKTTLINYLLYKLQLDINIGLITNTNIPASQFLKAICR
jgi:general secretion pathway protein A